MYVVLSLKLPFHHLTTFVQLWVPFFNLVQFVLGVSVHLQWGFCHSILLVDFLQHESETAAARCDEEREAREGKAGEGCESQGLKQGERSDYHVSLVYL
jgi:hypothetical protein